MKRIPRVRIRDRAELWASSVEPGQPLILEGLLTRWPLLSLDTSAARAPGSAARLAAPAPPPRSARVTAARPSRDVRPSRDARHPLPAVAAPPPPASLPPALQRLRDLAGHRPVMTSWSRQRGDGLLSYRAGGSGKSWSDARTSFAAFLDDVHTEATTPTGNVFYLQSSVVQHELPELSCLFPFDLLRPEELRQHSPRLWIGSGGHRVGLHFDIDHNLHCVVAGQKRFLIYPPSALPHVYLGALDASPAGAPTALVDPLHPDLAAFPRFAEVADQALVAELGPGDVLALPAYWLHHVESRGLNIAGGPISPPSSAPPPRPAGPTACSPCAACRRAGASSTASSSSTSSSTPTAIPTPTSLPPSKASPAPPPPSAPASYAPTCAVTSRPRTSSRRPSIPSSPTPSPAAPPSASSTPTPSS